MRNNFHLRYSQKSIEWYFSKVQSSPPPIGAIRGNLVINEDLQEEKKMWKNKNKKKWKEKNKKMERTNEIAAKNKELKRIKKAEK